MFTKRYFKKDNNKERGGHNHDVCDRSSRLQASLTVEAAMIIPVLFTAAFLLFYLTAHVHNRCVLGASAAEQAISGHEQEDPSYLAMTGLKCSRSDSEKERKVSYEAGTLYLTGETLWNIREEAAYTKLKPVKAIRKIAAAKRLATGDNKEK